MSPEQGRVRLRWSRGSYITAAMSWAEAAQLQDDVLADVVEKGDGLGFVDFTGHDGREVSVRARDVVAVECLPELPDRVPSAPRQAHTVPAGSISPATAFLRQHAGIPAGGASLGGPR